MKNFMGPVALTILAIGVLALIVRIFVLAPPAPQDVVRQGALRVRGDGQVGGKGQPAKAPRQSPISAVRAPSGASLLPVTEAATQDVETDVNPQEPTPLAVFETFAGAPGEEEFERQFAELLKAADIKMHEKMHNQDMLADVADQVEQDVETDVNPQELTPLAVFETFAGAPGEEMFENQFRDLREQLDNQTPNQPPNDLLLEAGIQ